MSSATNEHEVSIGETHVLLRSDNRSHVVTAAILGVDRNDGGEINRIYLDRYVHGRNATFRGWQATGAISTILTKAT